MLDILDVLFNPLVFDLQGYPLISILIPGLPCCGKDLGLLLGLRLCLSIELVAEDSGFKQFL